MNLTIDLDRILVVERIEDLNLALTSTTNR